MIMRWLGAIMAVPGVLAGCASPDSPPDPAGRVTSAEMSAGAPASFVNNVWVVAESKQVSPGELRVFLSEGTLVMASPRGTSALGTWRYQDGRLTITEEGISYPVDILELDSDTFEIRIRGPGDPVVIRFAPAEQPPLPQGPPA